jgi:hypothetical protein
MSKPDATGAKSLEEILASIRKSLGGAGEPRDAANGLRGAVPNPVQVAPEPEPLDDAASDVDGDGLSARLAGALSEPTNGAVLDDDFTELLAPDSKKPAPSEPAATAKPADARSEGTDPLWFLRRPSADAESKSKGSQPPATRTQPGEAASAPAPAQAPAPVEEVKLSRPEVLRASLPPLFGAETGHPLAAAARTVPLPDAPKAAPSVGPTARMPAAAPAALGEVGKAAPANLLTARTQPLLPPVQPADEAAKVVAEAEAPPAPAAREPTFFRAAAPAPVAEAAPEPQAESGPQAASGPQPAAEAKPANGLLTEVHADTAAKAAPALLLEPSVPKPAPAAEPPQARTLEQVIGEMLEPLIRQWLESNLPRLVEQVVREEVARAIAAERGAPKV